ncbi:MAG: glycosyltransferase family 4 protein, partial [Vicinamibacteraceae bacterium]
RYHIVHFLDGEHSGQYLPRFVRKMGLPRPRTVATFHQPPGLQRTLINPDVVRCFDHVTVFSPSQVPIFLEWLPPHRVHLLLHGIDIDFFHPPSAPRPGGRRIRCITVGHWLRDWDALRGVAQAFMTDPDVLFDVVTTRDTRLEGLPNVTHHRAIPDAALAELYRRADVLLLPLTECTANNALLEGIASGLPVVSSDFHGVRFHLSGDESLLASPGDVEGLVGAVRKLQREPALRLDMGRRARVRSEELAWSKVVNGFAELYEAVVAEPSSAKTVSATPKS